MLVPVPALPFAAAKPVIPTFVAQRAPFCCAFPAHPLLIPVAASSVGGSHGHYELGVEGWLTRCCLVLPWLVTAGCRGIQAAGSIRALKKVSVFPLHTLIFLPSLNEFSTLSPIPGLLFKTLGLPLPLPGARNG